ncbi:hypothetical protein DENSPDRAFT_844551 [Dentipellis sp. KUC8613]|nr:hypothetical protein DENSPDRAFT_844551 [Dentipellis sp. KUC8613]
MPSETSGSRDQEVVAASSLYFSTPSPFIMHSYSHTPTRTHSQSHTRLHIQI